jgi:hypothetical protein
MIVTSPSDCGEVWYLNGRNSGVHIEGYPGYEWMACTGKASHELGRPSSMELVTPGRDISQKAKFSVVGEGVGDAHSSGDRRDNITLRERRGIAIVRCPTNEGRNILSKG